MSSEPTTIVITENLESLEEDIFSYDPDPADWDNDEEE